MSISHSLLGWQPKHELVSSTQCYNVEFVPVVRMEKLNGFVLPNTKVIIISIKPIYRRSNWQQIMFRTGDIRCYLRNGACVNEQQYVACNVWKKKDAYILNDDELQFELRTVRKHGMSPNAVYDADHAFDEEKKEEIGNKFVVDSGQKNQRNNQTFDFPQNNNFRPDPNNFNTFQTTETPKIEIIKHNNNGNDMKTQIESVESKENETEKVKMDLLDFSKVLENFNESNVEQEEKCDDDEVVNQDDSDMELENESLSEID